MLWSTCCRFKQESGGYELPHPTIRHCPHVFETRLQNDHSMLRLVFGFGAPLAPLRKAQHLDKLCGNPQTFQQLSYDPNVDWYFELLFPPP